MTAETTTGSPSRDDNETTTPPASTGQARACPVCYTPFVPIRRQAYCTNACRQRAWRSRQHPPSTPTPPTPSTGSRREQTIYRCEECDTRYLASQWCPDCTRPCRRLGPGGECSCGDLLTIDELLGGQPMP